MAATMESSRIFVKNLPHSITEADFKKHFSAPKRQITDCRLIPKRRIGFVGYKSPEEAADAARYFNRSFLRMSKLSVEIARPITEAPPVPAKGVKRSRDDQPSRDAPATSGADTKAKKRKRDDVDESNPKVREYLSIMQNGKETFQDDAAGINAAPADRKPAVEDGEESDDEYEQLPAKKVAVKSKPAPSSQKEVRPVEERVPEPTKPVVLETAQVSEEPAPIRQEQPAVEGTDDDWLRSRTSRLLDLVEPDDPRVSGVTAPDGNQVAETAETPTAQDVEMSDATPAEATSDMESDDEGQDNSMDLLQETARLFVRNLAYTTKETDLRKHFASYGELEEVHLPVSNSGASKGFAMVKFVDPASAIAAFGDADGKTFQGRILHVLPAKAKRETKLDEFALSKLPLKKQNQIRKKAEAASTTFNWNSLFMDQAAVNDSVAARLGVEKSQLFDPTSADALVQQAIAETTVIQEAKAYYLAHGVDLESFKSQKRGDTTILVKGIPFGTSLSEIRAMFEKFGAVLQVLMPQSGTIAIVQFANAPDGKRAFAALCYSRIKDSILYLEKAPESIFVGQQPQAKAQGASLADDGGRKLTATTLLGQDESTDQVETSSLFVRNLNFSTTTEDLAEAFKALDGFVSARVKTKSDPKHAGQVLSMGFGFVAFRTREAAAAAIPIMNGHVLAAHTLEVKASHKGLDAAEERKRDDLAKKLASQQTKVVIKNLSFAVNAKELRALLSNYGKLRSLRIPKKFGGTGRGFAFADFATPREAANAIQTLKDTHLLGRKLVLDFAEADAIDPEEEIKRMEKKVGNQVKKVSMHQLAGRGKARVNIGEDAEEEME